MNASLYISFFQGQLESALEQVVQLAVREITGTVGASLSSMLLETARIEQENQRLRASIQSRRGADAQRGENGGVEAEDGQRERGEQRAGHSASQPGSLADSLRLEHKRRAVGQLKLVMERVLEFAVCELSKIVEYSLDDVLLELRKTEREHEELKLKLHSAGEENGASDAEVKTRKSRAKGNGVGSPRSSTDGVREEDRGAEQNTEDSAPSAVMSVSQDWVPVLNKVFGQSWCGDVWPLREAVEIKTERVRLSSEGSILEETTPQRNHDDQSDQPQWLGDTEMAGNFDPPPTPVSSTTGEDGQLKSPSMLHRLLTLPTRLLDGDDDSMESEDSLINAVISSHVAQTARREGAEDGEGRDAEEPDAEETVKPKSHKSGKKVHACKTCGEKFGRAHQLKTHRQTHKEAGRSYEKVHARVRTGSGSAT
ncbi:uncharacterized protein si:dkeyp-113d7.10 [Trichomycterus rosablanca]|uniref:uncharacterized protein si:dkeyp-113d7.10 n=1 Tax=Trichomycterus rosablanca TaxID=2290929 RepID=UPI002F359DB8